MMVKLNGNDFFRVTSEFGITDSVHLTPHTGLDLAMKIGTKLNSPVDGVIEKVVDYGNNNIGRGIIIETDSHEKVIMGHLSQAKVEVGQRVSEGDFVALSGSTGASTGGHLHLGLKDANNTFVNPDKLLSNDNGDGVVESTKSFIGFMNEWKEKGFFEAMYGKSFFEVCKDFTVQLIKDAYTFVIENGDLFFVLPAVIIMFGTFMVGKNKFSKLIIPLWFAYFVSVVLNYVRCLPPQ